MLDLAVPYMHKEVNAKEPIKSLDAQSDDENHKSSFHRHSMTHLSDTSKEENMIHDFV